MGVLHGFSTGGWTIISIVPEARCM